MLGCVSRYFTDFRKNCAQNQKSPALDVDNAGRCFSYNLIAYSPLVQEDIAAVHCTKSGPSVHVEAKTRQRLVTIL